MKINLTSTVVICLFFNLVSLAPRAEAQGAIPLWTSRSSKADPAAPALDSEGAPANPARRDTASQTQPIAWNELGAKATGQYSGDGLAVNAIANGARLRCVFQKLEGEVTPMGLWLNSTASSSNTPFRVLATSIGRELEVRTLASTGTVETSSGLARFIRPALIEEYRVSVDGLQQDFVLPDRLLPGEGTLRVELKLSGATADASPDGAHLVLEGSGRKLNYHRLRATDATGRELAARMEVVSATQLAVMVEDRGAVYPVRIDPTFSDANWMAMDLPGVNGIVYATVVDASGNLYVGGQFSWAGGIAASNIAKWNGTNWAALGTGMDSPVNPNGGTVAGVYALAVAGTDLYAGGYFTMAGGVAAVNIAKWNGSNWTALGSGLDGGVSYLGVLALAVSGGNLYAGGNFTTAGGLAAIRIAKWNGTGWSALGSGLNNYAGAMAVSGNDLYVGGGFTSAGGVAANYVAKWNGSSWSALGSGLNNAAIALAVSGSDVCAGGYFTEAGGVMANSVAKWNGHKWSALGSGLDGIVTSLAPSGSDLFAAGYFTSAGGVAANRIAKWNGSTWSALSMGLNGSLRALAVSGGNLYAGGNFTKAGGKVADCVAKWNGTNWSALGAGTNNFWAGGTVGALAVSGTNLYAGVDDHVARWDGSSWTVLPDWMAAPWVADAHVYALAVLGDDLYAGGEYLTYSFDFDEYYVGRVSKWNGTNWSGWGDFFGYSFSDFPSVNALAVSGSNLYAGGVFTTADGTAANNVAKWNESGWSGLGSGMDGMVCALTASGSDLYAGGEFITADGVAANHVARWNGSSWNALGSGMDQAVFALASSGGDLYAGGAFTTAGSTSANRIAKWNGSSWSALGSGITGGYNVYALAIRGGDLYVGGEFTTAGGVAANSIAKWDGNSWSALGSGMDGASPRVYAIAAATSGNELYAGGWFTTAGGRTSPNAARASLAGVPPLPSLTIRLTAPDAAAVSWPSGATGFVLQQIPTGSGFANWSNVTGTILDDGTNKFIIVNPLSGNRFYRLNKP